MRRLSTLLVALVPALVLLVLATTVTVPLVAMGPGPTFDTLGEIELPESDGGGPGVSVPVVEVTGRDPDPTSGKLDMTTVAVRDRLTLADAIGYWIDPEQTVVPRDQVFPPDRTEDEVVAENAADMTGSENSAEVAAYRQLGLPLQARIEKVTAGGAADGVLRDGDVVVSVDGAAMSTSNDVVEAVASRKAGERIRIGYRRAGRDRTVDLTLGRRPEDAPKGSDPDRGYLGILLGDQPRDGTDVRINLDPDVGGPSAGLVFALAIVDKLSPGELTGGASVAGTGTIDPDGEVGPIGGIRHKLLAARGDGATEFLVPADNCAEALMDPPEGMRLVKVSTLAGALDALSTIRSGGTPPTCG